MARGLRSKRLKTNKRAKAERVKKREEKLLGQIVQRMQAQNESQTIGQMEGILFFFSIDSTFSDDPSGQ
jgi:hypothetical protein